MKKVLAKMDNVDSYSNDLVIHTNNWKAHLQVLQELIRRLRETKLKAKPSKGVFWIKVVYFFGQFLAATGSQLMRTI